MNEAHQIRLVFVAVVMPYYTVRIFRFLIRLIDYGLCVCLLFFNSMRRQIRLECWNV